MSQSSNFEKNINIFSELSSTTDDNTITSTVTDRGIKRAASNPPEQQAKKMMVENSSGKEQASIVTPTSSDQPKFINASQMMAHAQTNTRMIPEISDEELLEMAIQFEKKHPQ